MGCAPSCRKMGVRILFFITRGRRFCIPGDWQDKIKNRWRLWKRIKRRKKSWKLKIENWKLKIVVGVVSKGRKKIALGEEKKEEKTFLTCVTRGRRLCIVFPLPGHPWLRTCIKQVPTPKLNFQFSIFNYHVRFFFRFSRRFLGGADGVWGHDGVWGCASRRTSGRRAKRKSNLSKSVQNLTKSSHCAGGAKTPFLLDSLDFFQGVEELGSFPLRRRRKDSLTPWLLRDIDDQDVYLSFLKKDFF